MLPTISTVRAVRIDRETEVQPPDKPAHSGAVQEHEAATGAISIRVRGRQTPASALVTGAARPMKRRPSAAFALAQEHVDIETPRGFRLE